MCVSAGPAGPAHSEMPAYSGWAGPVDWPGQEGCSVFSGIPTPPPCPRKCHFVESVASGDRDPGNFLGHIGLSYLQLREQMIDSGVEARNFLGHGAA